MTDEFTLIVAIVVAASICGYGIGWVDGRAELKENFKKGYKYEDHTSCDCDRCRRVRNGN